ncbi:MAG: hypothetical protein WCX82_02935 [archaeon]|jgi:hypothetical protein
MNTIDLERKKSIRQLEDAGFDYKELKALNERYYRIQSILINTKLKENKIAYLNVTKEIMKTISAIFKKMGTLHSVHLRSEGNQKNVGFELIGEKFIELLALKKSGIKIENAIKEVYPLTAEQITISYDQLNYEHKLKELGIDPNEFYKTFKIDVSKLQTEIRLYYLSKNKKDAILELKKLNERIKKIKNSNIKTNRPKPFRSISKAK